MKINNSQPSFGMALQKINAENFSRKEMDAIIIAIPELKKLAKDVDLLVQNKVSKDGTSYLEVVASGVKSFFQKLLGKSGESFSVTSNLDNERGYDVEAVSSDLVTIAKRAKSKYFKQSTEVGKKKLQEAMASKTLFLKTRYKPTHMIKKSKTFRYGK